MQRRTIMARQSLARERGRDDVRARKPPAIGWGLGIRLSLLTTIVVVSVMAFISAVQLQTDLQEESRRREEQLRASVAPLVTDLRAARSRDDARRMLARFHASYVLQGYADHALTIVDVAGRPVGRAGEDATQRADAPLAVVVPIANMALADDPLVLNVSLGSSGLQADLRRRWRAWALHVAATAGVILSLLYLVVRREVTGPIDRLLEGVRKMELGYWDDMPDPGGAWEIRWLGWRFHTLGEELRRTVEHLVAAQRRAFPMDRDADSASEVITGEAHPAPSAPDQPDTAATVLRLRARVGRLLRADPGAVESRMLAQSIWDNDATQAERLGQPELRMSLEDAALRILDPDAFLDISVRKDAERPRLEALARARGEQLRRALAARNIPVVKIHHRIKHPAGIWKKMLDKNLAFDQVHDLVALRVIVPTGADCYHALGVIHDLYAPIVGRFKDYIALPKPNGYRSIHTSVRDPDGAVFEVQIRSIAMHRHAEQGPASHADYKEATRIPPNRARVASWRRFFGIGRKHRESQRP